ncbi:MAG TPA: hypothetical protein VGF59_18875 [Bryobacteraceae bacterium]
MSVWPEVLPGSLSGREGDLVSASIHVDPRCLELLLEALAHVSFPINPQIYHDAVIVCRYADGREDTEGVTLVEFPAYAGRLDEVRRALESHGFDPANLYITGMLDAIHEERAPEPAPPGAKYVARYRVRRRAAGGAAA